MISCDDLRPGDGIIYTGTTFFDDIEKVKLGSDATHFEVYVGRGLVVTSLMKPGVGIYSQSVDAMLAVIRPIQPFDISAALIRFNKTIHGLPYGTRGLLGFTDQNVADEGLFCSQTGCEFYRGGGLEPFNSSIEARKVSPMHFLYVSEKIFQVFH
jgi:hypothetical protein